MVVEGAGKTSRGWAANLLYPIVAGLGLGLVIAIIIPPKALPPPRNADLIAGRLHHQLGHSVSCGGPYEEWPYEHVHIIGCGDGDPRSEVEFGWGQESYLDAWVEDLRVRTWFDMYCTGVDSCQNQVVPEGYADCVEAGDTVIAVWDPSAGLTLRKAILREFGGKLISPC